MQGQSSKKTSQGQKDARFLLHSDDPLDDDNSATEEHRVPLRKMCQAASFRYPIVQVFDSAWSKNTHVDEIAYTRDEIAEILGIGIGTVDSRLGEGTRDTSRLPMGKPKTVVRVRSY